MDQPHEQGEQIPTIDTFLRNLPNRRDIAKKIAEKEDVFEIIAGELLSCPLSEVSKQDRFFTKQLIGNFNTLYPERAQSFSDMIKEEEAKLSGSTTES